VVCLKKDAQAELHYAVLTGLGEERVWLNDPGRKKPGTIRRAEFDKIWNRAGRWVLLAVPRGSK
jgi:uncharacterized protein YvpB